MQQLNDGALSLLYDFGKAFVSTSRISLAFGRHMISERHAGAEMASLKFCHKQLSSGALRVSQP